MLGKEPPSNEFLWKMLGIGRAGAETLHFRLRPDQSQTCSWLIDGLFQAGLWADEIPTWQESLALEDSSVSELAVVPEDKSLLWEHAVNKCYSYSSPETALHPDYL